MRKKNEKRKSPVLHLVDVDNRANLWTTIFLSFFSFVNGVAAVFGVAEDSNARDCRHRIPCR